MGRQREINSVLPRSKKIKKTVHVDSPQSHDNSGKKYKTFNIDDKKRILQSFKKNLASLPLAHIEVNNLSPNELLRLIDGLHINDFNTVLNNSLLKNVVSYKTDVQSLRRWRRRIKEWIISSEKPETRGQILIPREKLDLFKKYLIPELQQMPCRNLIILRQKLSDLFKKIDHPIKKHTCSKHWWYTFLDKNREVKTLWDSLPKRFNMFNLSELSNSDFHSHEEMEEEFATELPSSAASDYKEEDDEIKKEHFFFPQEETTEERGEIIFEEDNFPYKEEEFESLIPGPLDIMINPQAFQHEMVIEELQRWREWRDSLNGDLQYEPVFNCLQLEPVQVTYRDYFFQEKEDIVSLLETALEMNITSS